MPIMPKFDRAGFFGLFYELAQKNTSISFFLLLKSQLTIHLTSGRTFVDSLYGRHQSTVDVKKCHVPQEVYDSVTPS